MSAEKLMIELYSTDPYGPKKIQFTNHSSNTICYHMRRDDVDEEFDDEFFRYLHMPGVYILWGNRTMGTGIEVYVGMSEDVAGRLHDHKGVEKAKSNKPFWDECMTFVTETGLTMSHADYLEKAFYERMRESKLFTFNNERRPDNKSANDQIKAECWDILEDAKLISTCIGMPLFPKGIIRDEFEGISVLRIQYKGIDAIGHYHHTDRHKNGFMVHAGSVIADKCTAKAPDALKKRRRELEKYDVIGTDNGRTVFLNNRIFESPGIAASVVCGRSAGEGEWKE